MSAMMGYLAEERRIDEVQRILPILRRQTINFERTGAISPSEADDRHERINQLRGRLLELGITPLSEQPPPIDPVKAIKAIIKELLGADPFYGRFTPDEPFSLPLPPEMSFQLADGSESASVTMVRPGLWGGGTQDVTVMESHITVAQENNAFRLVNFGTTMSPFDVNGVSSGTNHGFVPPGGQVWSSFDVLTGDFVAHAEGLPWVGHRTALPPNSVFLSARHTDE
jgi:hypothetical protein